MQLLYLVLAQKRLCDTGAALALVKECYGGGRARLAPLNMGLVVETQRPIPDDEMQTLGVITFE